MYVKGELHGLLCFANLQRVPNLKCNWRGALLGENNR